MRRTVWGGLALALLLTFSGAATASPREGGAHRILRRLSGGEVLGRVVLPPGRRVHGRARATPPTGRTRPERRLAVPFARETAAAPRPLQAATDAGLAAAVPDVTLVVGRNDGLDPVSAGLAVSNVGDPSLGGEGSALLVTGGYYAAISTDDGATFAYLDPATNFPATPFPFTAAFCCDQRVAQDPARGLVVWYLQYDPTGSTASDTNGVRLAVAHGAADLASNTWQVHDLTPASFGLPAGTWLAFPHLQVSDGFLYLTSNAYRTTDNAFQAAVVGRLSLDALDANAALVMNTLTTSAYGSIMAVHGATDTMYFAAVAGSAALKVLTWPEAEAAPAIATVDAADGLAPTIAGSMVCTGPDGDNPCARASTGMQTGWIVAGELGLMWHSAQDPGQGRPYPFVRAALLDPATKALLAQPDLYSPSFAWLYPAVAVNGRGHLGGSSSALGGDRFPELHVLVRDDLSPDVATSGWETAPLAGSDSGSPHWGDYGGAAVHAVHGNTWRAAGHVRDRGPADPYASPRHAWFLRLRDVPSPGPVPVVGFDAAGATVSEASGALAVTVSVGTEDDSPLAAPVTVSYAITPGSAVEGADYVATSGTLTFPAGTPSGAGQTISVTVVDDADDEFDEYFTLSLGDPTGGAVLGRLLYRAVLSDDDPAPTVSVMGMVVAEGDGPGSVTLDVGLSAASSRTVTVAYATADGTASAGNDYGPTSGTLTFAPGTTVQTVTIDLFGDALDENDESFVLALSDPVNATLGPTPATVTLLDDDPTPTLAVADVEVTEGDDELTPAPFVVSLSAPSGLPVTVTFATADGSATAGADYDATTGTLSFPPGTVSQTVGVLVRGDWTLELDETFELVLSAAVYAGLADDRGTGTIRDDESLPAVSLSDARVPESAGAAVFTATLSLPSALPVTVSWSTSDGSALAGRDYLAASGVLTFGPGSTSETLSIVVLDDTRRERNEGFLVTLGAPVGGKPGRTRAQGVVRDDDGPQPDPVTPVLTAPITLAEPGLYALERDLATSKASGAAITVAADGVGLDLGGHVLSGTAGTGTLAEGVVTEGHQRVSVRNGTVTGFHRGVRLVAPTASPTSDGLRALTLRAVACTYAALWLEGRGNAVGAVLVEETGGTTALGADADGYGIVSVGPAPRVVNSLVLDTRGTGSGAGIAIRVTDGTGASITQNRLAGGSMPGSAGVLLEDSPGVVVRDNRLHFLDRGIALVGTSGGTLAPNLMIGVTQPIVGP